MGTLCKCNIAISGPCIRSYERKTVKSEGNFGLVESCSRPNL
jgi:hypothetical protein